MMAKAIPDAKFACTNWAVDDFVIAECTMNGTDKGPMVMPGMKIKATNKPLTMHSVDVIQMKDGKAISGTSYGNGMEMAMQLGLMKPMGEHKAMAADAKKPAAPATK
jgi:hypothetical protein